MPVNPNDPRVKRTRQLLTQAFMELLKEKKNIHSISVQDIAERATLNRATFYSHFEDKYAFLEHWIGEKFQKNIEVALPNSSLSDIRSLKTLIAAVFEFLAYTRQVMRPGDSRFEPLFEIAMQKELYHLLKKWLTEGAGTTVSKETVEATALVMSWGIFGSAVQWSRSSQNRTAQEMASDVLEVVAAGLAPVIT